MAWSKVQHALLRGAHSFRAGVPSSAGHQNWVYGRIGGRCDICTYSSVPPLYWQAAVLWRCADCFENDMIKQSDFHKLLASLLGPTVGEVKLLEESDGLTQMMIHSQCLEEDGKANIRKFVQHCFRRKDGDLPLEDESWDHLLYKKLRWALGLENEVASHACMHVGMLALFVQRP